MAADEVDNYKVDFETRADVSNHAFKVAAGWAHIVDSYETTSWYGGGTQTHYAEYTYWADEGVGGSTCLGIGQQNNAFYDYNSYSYKSTNDALVTPEVSGTVTLDVKYSSQSDYGIRFYNVNYENGAYSLGDEITADLSAVNTDSFVTVTIPVSGSQRVAIVGSNVRIDNFTATKADVVLQKSLAFGSVSGTSGHVDCDADGKYNVSYTFNLNNTGDVDLDANTITVSLLNAADSSVVATKTIDAPIAAGATSDDITIDADQTLGTADTIKYILKENISNSTTEAGTVIPVAYKPEFSLHGDDKTFSAENPLNFGFAKGETTANLQLMNTGAAPLTISSVAVSGNYSTTFEAQTIAAHSSAMASVTLSGDATDEQDGSITFSTTDSELGNITIPLKGFIVDSTAYFEPFNDSYSLPSELYNENDSWRAADIPAKASTEYGNESYARAGQDANAKLVTPKVQFADGDKIRFEAAGFDDVPNAKLHVYFSTDRKAWTELTAPTGITGKFAPYSIDAPQGEGYVAFAGENVGIDNIIAGTKAIVSHDLVIESTGIPSSGEVNTAFSAKATVRNLLTTAEKEGSVSAVLHLGDETFSASAKSIDASSTATFSFSATPHTEGAVPAWVEIATADGEFSASSDTTNINVAAEIPVSEIQVGKQQGSSYGSLGDNPINTFSSASESNTYYKKSQIGLNAGEKIQKIVWKGELYSAYKTVNPFDVSLRVYITNTDDSVYTEPYVSPDTTSMTKVYDGKYTLTPDGDRENLVDMISIPVNGGFEYTGKNLLVTVVMGDCPGNDEVEFATDESVNNQSIIRSAINGGLESAQFSVKDLPVIYLYVNKTAKSISGKVSDDEGNAIEGAKVALTSGNVEYSSNTASDGTYSVNVIKDELTYKFRIEKAGFTPYKEDSVVVSEDVANKNIVLSATNNLFVDDAVIPTTGTVNHPSVAKVTVFNPTTEDVASIDDNTTKVGIDIDGERYYTTIDELKAGESKTYNVTFYPHKSGENTAFVVIANNDEDEVYADTTTINVAAEVFEKTVVAGTPSVNYGYPATSYSSPVQFSVYHSMSNTIYTADKLKDMASGSNITGMHFRGYIGSAYSTVDSYKSYVKVYLKNTSESVLPEGNSDDVDTATMTLVFADSVDVEAVGSSTEFVDLLPMTFKSPFQYDGTNLQVYVEATSPEDKTTSSYFECESRDYNAPITCVTRGYSYGSMSNWYGSDLAVAYLNIENRKTATITVVNRADSSAIAGASVVVRSGDVRYEGTTDAEGKTEIAVAQPSLEYEAIVTAPRRDTVTVCGLNFAEDIADTVALGYVTIVSGTIYGKSLAGVVAPLANATVTITAGDSTFTATTDADGKYTLPVYYDTLGNVQISVSAENYLNDDTTIDLELEDVTFNDTLNIDPATGIDAVNANGKKVDSDAVYTIDGKFVGKGIDPANLPRGLYIIGKRKIAIK